MGRMGDIHEGHGSGVWGSCVHMEEDREEPSQKPLITQFCLSRPCSPQAATGVHSALVVAATCTSLGANSLIVNSTFHFFRG